MVYASKGIVIVIPTTSVGVISPQPSKITKKPSPAMMKACFREDI